jgi:hypothetical protein
MDWIPAFFGLVGVIVGGLITAGSNYYLDRQREQATRARDNLNYEIEIKRAARLIDEELYGAKASVESVIELRLWSPEMEPKTEAWQEYGPIMAPRLSFDDWKALTIAVQAMKDVSFTMKYACLGAATPCEIPASAVTKLSPTIECIDAALAAIAPLVSDDAPTALE